MIFLVIFHYFCLQCNTFHNQNGFLDCACNLEGVGVNWALYWHNKPVLFAPKQSWILQNVSQQLTFKCLKLKEMTENIISDTNKSNCISKRVREDRTLIKEVGNIEFIINRSGDKSMPTAVNQLNHFSE